MFLSSKTTKKLIFENQNLILNDILLPMSRKFCVSAPNGTLWKSDLKIDAFYWPTLFTRAVYVYVYIYICVCMCVCVCEVYSSLNNFLNYVKRKTGSLNKNWFISSKD
jgi:hypothetical protein